MFFQDTSGCADLLIQTKYDTMNLDTKKMLLIVNIINVGDNSSRPFQKVPWLQ